jgi:hypothetical protein
MRLADAVKELSSKNAGNFHLTFDIVFDNPDYYRQVKASNLLTTETISSLYGVSPSDVLDIIFFDPGNAVKIAMRRARPSGDPGETDVYGAQQYPPLLDLDVAL